jgi:hypothetical protein
MKNVFKFVLLLAFTVSAFAWTGCSKDDKKSSGGNSIIGAWERTDEDGTVITEYKSGGQYISYFYENNDLKSAVKGEFSTTATELTGEIFARWDLINDVNGNQFPDADEFVTIPSEEDKASYIVSGDKLTIKNSEGEETVYTRTTSPTPTTPANQSKYSPINRYANGNHLAYVLKSNRPNFSHYGDEIMFLVKGETYSFEEWVFVKDEKEAWTWYEDPDYDKSGSIWTLKGDVGYIGTQGNTQSQGGNVTLTITAAAGTEGALAVELDGMLYQAVIRVVATAGDLPESK